jgi:hypothetical protein
MIEIVHMIEIVGVEAVAKGFEVGLGSVCKLSKKVSLRVS